MYKIIPAKKSTKEVIYHDYMFTDFENFYKIASVITVPLIGKYSIGIKTSDVQAVKDFIKVEEKYSSLMIYIYMPEELVSYMSMRDFSLKIQDRVKPFEEFMKIASQQHVLFEKGMDVLLYSSIEHDYDSMEEAILLVRRTYGQYKPVSEKMLAQIFSLNKIVYPRTVLLEYLWLKRYREQKLAKCISAVGNDVALGACIKNIRSLVDQKAKYFKSGSGSNLLKSLDTNRVLLMYRILDVERNNVKDLSLLLKLYERGLSSYDIIQERDW